MKLISIKHVLLLIICFLTLFKTLSFGDYCTEIMDGIFLLCLYIAFFFMYLGFQVVNLVQVTKKKGKIDVLLPVLLIVTVGLNWIVLNDDDRKPWTDVVYTAEIERENNDDLRIQLFDNGTFEATLLEEFSCTYTGEYTQADNQITIKHENLDYLQSEGFSEIYQLNRSTCSLIPMDSNAEILKLSVCE